MLGSTLCRRFLELAGRAGPLRSNGPVALFRCWPSGSYSSKKTKDNKSKESKIKVDDTCKEKEKVVECPKIDESACKARDLNRSQRAVPPDCPPPAGMEARVPPWCLEPSMKHLEKKPSPPRKHEKCEEQGKRCPEDESVEFRRQHAKERADPKHASKNLSKMKAMDKAWKKARAKYAKKAATNTISCKTEKPKLENCPDAGKHKKRGKPPTDKGK